ncbi:MAG: DNA polymerase III subunit alpha [Erysipelotrichaceae bacterium]|nr:DNA polymerase III subunit alpha [Erysipelotrichaceae bacterium]MDY5252315.1 DNA polymerase III subunit alpha [Erysipelotrichaceae bacterium]
MIHLHAVSAYTLLNSTLTIDQLIHHTQALGLKSACLSDRHVMYGAMEFKKKCEKANIKPLYGMIVEVVDEDRLISMELIAKNDRGFQALMHIATYLSSHENYPLSSLVDHSDDLVIIVFADEGQIEKAMIAEAEQELLGHLSYLQERLSLFYMAISLNESSFWKVKNDLLKACCTRLKIKTVAINKIYYAKEEDSYSYKIIRGIKENKLINDPSLPLIKSRYIKSESQMCKEYEIGDLMATEEIGMMCNVQMHYAKANIPVYPKQNKVTSFEYLKQLCMFGLARRLNNQIAPHYKQRLLYELSIIEKMHFEDYFLIVYDFILYAKKHDIYVGPGRGSAAGSLVSYCLGITDIDPLKYNLLFERFLNPERISMPDIDTDFPDDHRDEIIDYVYETYGKQHVAHILTFNTLGAKQVIRDVGKVLNIHSFEIDKVAKMIPNTPKITLSKALQDNQRLLALYQQDKKIRQLIDEAMKLEGLPRHTSIHAAGIVLSKQKLEDIIPLINDHDDHMITQYTMEYLEELGLIKMDFLALRNLTIIDDTVNLIHHQDLTFDILKIPLDDAKTYKLIRQTDTVGIFQLESDGMRNLLRKIQPTCFEDIALTIALFRPGPMENIDIFLKNKNDPYHIQYPCKEVEDILKETYGIMIYQEQISTKR